MLPKGLSGYSFPKLSGSSCNSRRSHIRDVCLAEGDVLVFGTTQDIFLFACAGTYAQGATVKRACKCNNFRDVVSHAIAKSLETRATEKKVHCTPASIISECLDIVSTALSCASCFAYKGLEVCPESLRV